MPYIETPPSYEAALFNGGNANAVTSFVSAYFETTYTSSVTSNVLTMTSGTSTLKLRINDVVVMGPNVAGMKSRIATVITYPEFNAAYTRSGLAGPGLPVLL